MLQLQNVQKSYRNFLALDIPSLTISPGLVWLQGENGSGKTTFLKMVAGLVPYQGNIVLDTQYSLNKQRTQFLSLVNYAEAEPLYPSFLTAMDLLKLYCYSKKGSLQHTMEMLKQLHLTEDVINKPVATFSSGMIKKLSLALAFVGNPKLILLDEPFITIDVHAVDVLCNIIQTRCKAGVSFIITSHQSVSTAQLNFAETFSATNRTILKIS